MEQFTFDNITLIPGRNRGRYPFCNTLLIEDAERVLVDPACGRSEMKAVAGQGAVDVIINTHYHEDHVTYNHLFPDAGVYVHEADRRGLESIDGYFEMGLEMPPALRHEWIGILKERFHYLGWPPAQVLHDGQELRFGDTRAVVIHTPGHTPGHICLHFPDHDLVYLADLDMTRFGPWYGDAASDIDELISSIKKIESVHAGYYIPSHDGPVLEDISQAAPAFMDVIFEREQRVLENIRTPATFEELVGRWIIYGKPRSPAEYFIPSEIAMLRKHLDRLIASGNAVLEDGKYCAAAG